MTGNQKTVLGLGLVAGAVALAALDCFGLAFMALWAVMLL